jgi:hypothetical protein
MIVTRELLVHLGACQEAINWFDTKNLTGLSRLAFIRALKDSDGPADYAEWAASKQGLFSAEAVEFVGTGVRLNIWRVCGEGFDPLVEYTDLAVIKPLIDAQVDPKIAAESEHFHVYAQQMCSEGGCLSVPCDLESDTAPEGCHYATFNMFTGVYEDFDSFLDAKRRCSEIKKLRRDQYASTYHVMQKIEEADSSEGGLSDLLVFTGVTLTTT